MAKRKITSGKPGAGPSVHTMPFDGRSVDGQPLHVARDTGGAILGFASKHPDTTTEKHPIKIWRAVLGQGPVRAGDMVRVDYQSTTVAGAIRRAIIEGERLTNLG